MAAGHRGGQRSFRGVRAGLGGIFAAGVASAFAPAAGGADVQWINTGEGNWVDAANWEGGNVPAAADNGRINNGGTAVIAPGHAVSIQFAILGDNSTNSGTLRMTGGSLTTTSDIRVGGNGGTNGGAATFHHSGGAALLNGGNVNVGFGSLATGTYNLSGGSLQVNAGTIIAVGNRGNGTFDQSGGTVYVKGGANTVNGVLNIARNAAGTSPAPGATGTVRISGGTMAVANVRFGNAAGGTGVNQLALSGTGKLLTHSITVFAGYTGTNTVSFTGGTLTAGSVALPLANNGGILAPATVDFAAAPADINALTVNPVGTTTLVGDNGYTQGSTGVLAVDLASLTGHDRVDIGAGTNTAGALLAGTIAVNLLDGFNPATGSTFDVLAADSVGSTAVVTGQTPGGDTFVPSVVTGDDGRQVLRLTVTAVPEPGLTGLGAVAGIGMLARRARRRE